MRVRLAAPLILVLTLVLVFAWAMTVEGSQILAAQSPPQAEAPDAPASGATASLSRTLSYASFLPLVGTDVAPLYRDDFSNPASGWYVGDNGNVRWEYRAGGYELTFQHRGWWGAEDAPWSGRRNYAVASDMRQLADSGAAYGLIFGFQDWSRFYVLIVSPADQQYAILKRIPASPYWVHIVPLTDSTLIRQGALPNRLRVERNGSDIAAYINGRLVRTVRDGSYLGVTNVGIYAASGSITPVTARFDNFTVWALGSAAEDAGELQRPETPEVLPGMSGPDAPEP